MRGQGDFRQGDRRLHQGVTDRSEERRGLHQPRPGLSPDQPQRPGAGRLQPRPPDQPEPRAGLSRTRQPAARAGQLRPGAWPTSTRRSSSIRKAAGRPGVPRPWPDPPEARANRRGPSPISTMRSIGILSRRALPGARPEPHGAGQIRPGDRGLNAALNVEPRMPKPGPISASPTRNARQDQTKARMEVLLRAPRDRSRQPNSPDGLGEGSGAYKGCRAEAGERPQPAGQGAAVA